MSAKTKKTAEILHMPSSMHDGESARSRATLARLPAPMHQVREKAASLLAKTLKALFDGADDALFDLADKATNNQDQNVYFEAMREVRLRRREVEAGFFCKLDEAYAALLREESVVVQDEVSLDDLSLVAHEQLECQVAVDAMIAKALEQAAEAAQHIALRFDSLVPVKVYQQNSPIGPDVLCRSFQSVVEPLDVDIKAKLVLLKLFDKAVVSQLPKIYTLLNNLLIQQNILPSLTRKQAGARRTSVVNREPSGVKVAGSDQTQSEMASQAADDTNQVLQQLRALLPAATESSRGSAGGSGQLLAALTQLQHQGAVEPSFSGRELMASLSASAPQAVGGVDQDVINLVNMLFEFILDDRSLASGLKALLARLQIPMLKVAVVDKDFFNRSSHSARRLLNELATAALGWQPPAKEGTRDLLFEKIESVVQRILSDFDSDLVLFDELLAEFLAFMEKEKRRAMVLEKRTLDAEDGKAKAQRGRKQVDDLMAELMAAQVLPEGAESLLEGPWSNVLFLIGLKQGQGSEEWQQARRVAEDLIWSVSDESMGDRSRLVGLIPDLLARLRAGFETISLNPFEVNKILRGLEPLHLARMKGKGVDKPEAKSTSQLSKKKGESVSNVDSPSANTAVPKPAFEQQDDLGETSRGALDMDAEFSDIDRDLSSFEEKESASVQPAFLQQVDGLAQGSWFEVAEQDNPVFRCRLAAVIKSVDKYIFVNRNGMKVAEKTRESLAQALAQGAFRLLDDGMLFDRALEAVIGDLRSARQGNS